MRLVAALSHPAKPSGIEKLADKDTAGQYVRGVARKGGQASAKETF